MKKHLIAAAVAAAVAVPAMAQNVTVYGILGAAYTDVETSFGSAKVDQTNTGSDNQQAGNRIGFRGTEDLGGGLKASFVYELSVSAVNGIGGVRLGYADLGGSFGNARIGRQDTVTRQIYNGFTSFGNSVFTPGNIGAALTSLAGIAVADNVRGCAALSGAAATDCTTFSSNIGYGGTRVNGFSYISPKFGGANVVVQYGETSTDGLFTNLKEENKSTNIGLFYSAGPLALAVGQDKVKIDSIAVTTTTTANIVSGAVSSSTTRAQADKVDLTTNMIGASYDLSVAKVFVTYVDKKFEVGTDPSDKVKDMTVGVSVPVGALTLVGSYTDGEVKGDGYKDDIKGYQLQANYALSKRTRAYAMYGQSKYEIQGDDNLKQKGFALGIQHNF